MSTASQEKEITIEDTRVSFDKPDPYKVFKFGDFYLYLDGYGSLVISGDNPVNKTLSELRSCSNVTISKF